jgi:hypothetical protein
MVWKPSTTGIVEIAAYSRKEMIYHIEDLLQ